MPPAIESDSYPLATGASPSGVFELSPDLLCVAGKDGYFRQVNPAWSRATGWSREELLAQPLATFIHPEDLERTLQARRELLKGQPLVGFENRYRCKDGSYRWLSWHSKFEPGEEIVFATARDVTQRRYADQARQTRSRLESNRVLTSGLAHDFNNLLGGLLLNLEMIKIVGPLTDQQLPHLQQASDATRAASRLVRNLLSLSYRNKPIAVPGPINAILPKHFQEAVADSAMRPVVEIATDLDPVFISSENLRLVMQNLVLNAREATDDRGPLTLRAFNTVHSAWDGHSLEPGNYVCISLTDTGPGISDEVMPKVFDAYFSTKPRGNQKGMGLGLTVCLAILEDLHGEIVLHAPAGQGATVHCYLPAAPQP